MNCPKITGAGVQWLATGCPALSSLNVKGTKATLTTLNIVKERYPYSRIKASFYFLFFQSLRRIIPTLRSSPGAAGRGTAYSGNR